MLGSAASALHTMDALKAERQRKLDSVKGCMRSHADPPSDAIADFPSGTF